MMMKFFLVVSLSVTFSTAFGQGSHSVDLVTGTANVSIPLFSISNGDIEVPGGLSYVANGVRITDDDGWVGHNWTMSAQAYGIYREMKGLPDDYTAASPDNRKGWLFGTMRAAVQNFAPTTDNNPATCADELANYNFLNSIGYNQDTEPDAFHVSAPGLAFTFYFDENRVPQVAPYEDVVITPYTSVGPFSSTTTSGPIISFYVKNEAGVEYRFTITESVEESLLASNPYYLARRSNLHLQPFNYNVSWKLTSIVSPIYGTVSFSYKAISIPDNNPFKPNTTAYNRYKYRYPINMSSCAVDHKLEYSRKSTIQVLTSVSSPTVEAVFTSVPKAGSVIERLSSISLYDKREGVSKLTQTITLAYHIGTSEKRAFLVSVTQTAGVSVMKHSMDYYGEILPGYESKSKDEWEFYKLLTYKDYDQTTVAGSLKRIVFPYKGFTAFIYEVHDYWNGTAAVEGAGLRIKKIISHDGISSANDITDRYTYKASNGQTSGKLQYQPQFKFWTVRNSISYSPSCTSPVVADESLSEDDAFQGSSVAYERVTVSRKDGGSSIYEFDLPASFGDVSANNNEWEASKVEIARPSTGTSACYLTTNVQTGINKYPFPPSPNYGFAKGLKRKQTDLREDGIKVREVVFNYKRIYKATSIRKIFGLSLEELATAYHNGSTYINGKMFVYSKYPIFTDVNTVLQDQTETLYHSNDLVKKTTTKTDFLYESPYHRRLTKTIWQDNTALKTVTEFKYVQDYTTSTASDPQTLALKNLQEARRNNIVVESITKKNERTTNAGLTIFQILNGIVFPHKQYEFKSVSGVTDFLPSSSNGSTFTFDQAKYTLTNTSLSFDSYGNVLETVGRDKQVRALALGYIGTLPIVELSNARLQEIRFSDFDVSTPVSFSQSGAGSSGRNGSKSYNLQSFPTGLINSNVTYQNPKSYIFSCWINSGTAGTLTVTLVGPSTVNTQIPFLGIAGWKYYSAAIPIPSTFTTSSVEVKSNVNIQVDDVAFFPEHADLLSSMHSIPYGKSLETDSRGNAVFYDYDGFGRLKGVYDRDRNVVKKYDYLIKP